MRADRDELQARIHEHSAALADAEARYQSLFENAVSGIYQSLPGTGGFLNVNPAFAHLLGYADPDILVSTLKDLDSVYVRAGRRAELQRRLEAEDVVIGGRVGNPPFRRRAPVDFGEHPRDPRRLRARGPVRGHRGGHHRPTHGRGSLATGARGTRGPGA